MKLLKVRNAAIIITTSASSALFKKPHVAKSILLVHEAMKKCARLPASFHEYAGQQFVAFSHAGVTSLMTHDEYLYHC